MPYQFRLEHSELISGAVLENLELPLVRFPNGAIVPKKPGIHQFIDYKVGMRTFHLDSEPSIDYQFYLYNFTNRGIIVGTDWNYCLEYNMILFNHKIHVYDPIKKTFSQAKSGERIGLRFISLDEISDEIN
ncbi:Uncharacterised protein [uncultured archaeon]|nr:Uncharacterised protein [uncultured archaeon]